ncbi:MAG: hypothetical protein K1X79_08845 [Oligoflexia bacterium]|nr:hypothetical protein [Oligoflexia bacterium]
MPVIVQDPGAVATPQDQAQAILQALRQDASRPAEVRPIRPEDRGPDYQKYADLIDRVRQGKAAVLSEGDPVGHHQVFGFGEFQQDLKAHMAGVPQGAELDYPPLPDAVAKMHGSVAKDHSERDARDLWARSVRSQEVEGEVALTRAEVREKLGAHTPEVAAQICRDYVEQVLWSNPDSLAGVTKEQLVELKRMREQANSSSATQADKDTYTKLCQDLVTGNLATFDKGLTQFAVRGMDPHKSAEEINKIVLNSALNDQAKREKILELVGNATPKQLEQIALHYNGIAERGRAVEMQKVAAEIVAAEKDGGVRLERAWANATKLLSALPPSEASKLEALADQEAQKSGKTAFRDLAYKLKPENRDRLLELAKGFDAGRRVDKIIGACEGSGTNNEWVYQAVGYIPDPSGKTPGISALTKEQITALEAAWQARSFSGKPEGTLVDYLKGDIDADTSEGLKVYSALAHPSPTADTSGSTFYADISKLDPNLTNVSVSIRYGTDIGLAQSMLHDRIEKFSKGKDDPERLIGLLEHGASSTPNYYLSDHERILLIQSHDEAHPGQTVRDGLKARLEGDDLTRALLAHDLGFYATQQAQEVNKNLRHIANIAVRAETMKDLHDCIDQTDKQYQRFYGTTLEQAVNDSSLSQAEKDKLLAYVYLPRSIELGTELKKETPDLGRIDSLIARSPAMVTAYDTAHKGEPGLIAAVENLAKTGKAPWEGVAWTEAKVSGKLAPETLDLLWKGLESGHSMETVVQLAPDSILSKEEKARALPYALITRTGELHDELTKDRPREDEIRGYLNGGLSDPRIMSAQYSRLFAGADISADLYKLAEKPETGDRKLSLGFVGAQQLRLAGINPQSLKKLNDQLAESAPHIGDKDSVLRGLKPEEAKTLEQMYNWVEESRARDRGEDKFVSFVNRISNLREAGNLSYDQLVRTAMLIDGADPWNLAAEVGKQPAKTLDLLQGLDPDFKLQIARVYREEHKGVGIFSDFNARRDELKPLFAHAEDIDPWLMNVADSLYGHEARQAAVGMDTALTALRDAASSPLVKAQSALDLIATMEASYARKDYLQAVEMYDDGFHSEELGTRSAFYAHLDEAHANGSLTDADYQKIINLATGNVTEPVSGK